ncbi:MULTISPECIES: YdcH family protein [unclassified Acinetobacter]|uniref:YdcH family protein n=1 Tax=unclassified Acinetobacter TaxID=196816 RepID=UPI0029346775|nr:MULTISPECIES: YdcH family protein [unclassified Acinetobacter]WOE30585.1 YdcH family protein [Acinetobacter sp. SAAs470]WOE38777.1 YdcH family protein [Acinetobacter sp. SAAs474]
MFPEYRALISKLKQENAHFSKIFDEHNALDHEIIRLEQDIVTNASTSDEIEVLKRKKLKLKDEIYLMLKQAEA